uniref:Sulfotransferase domain-containing protein n=1 Tax=viral metagenome TaxID=1070528 RepID=A0A6C0EUC1_9ZZZZ
MPYFNNNDVNILLIHIPKTGGTSLENYFSKKFDIPLDTNSLWMFFETEILVKNNIFFTSTLQHLTYQTIFKYNKFLKINYDNITIITIVRNPYERIISDLFFLKKININTSKEEVFDIIKTYLTSDNLDNHNIPQYHFITNDNKELIPNIHILHCETLTTDMHNLGYTDFNIHIHNNPIKTDYYNFLNNDSIKLINYFYHYDFKLFNYNKKLCVWSDP